jgi:hypothetical protein
MRKLLLSTLAAVTWLSGTMVAGEKHMMHCFAFTAKPEATAADWAAFHAATDAMPSKMPMVKMVWAGKLRAPLTQFAPDPETRKQFNATTDKANGGIVRVIRQYGACFAMDNGGAETLKSYTAHPYHATWMAAYEKVRVAGTTTYDIIGQ